MAFRIRGVTPTLKTDDLEATIAFYTGVLGFRVDTLDPEDDPSLCILDCGPVHLSFYLDEEEREPEPALTGQISFDVDDLDDLHDRIRDEAEILWGPEEFDYGRREMAIHDPNGYVLVFGEPSEPYSEEPHEEGEAG